jgi:hypothetical protein
LHIEEIAHIGGNSRCTIANEVLRLHDQCICARGAVIARCVAMGAATLGKFTVGADQRRSVKPEG